AFAAMSCPVEIGFSRSCVAGNYVLHLVTEAVRSLVDPGVQKFGYIVSLRVSQASETRHALIGAALVQEGSQQFAFFIVKHNRGTYQVRTLRAGCIVAMTEAAILNEQLLPA